ncbi:MAG: hypothetical protein ACKVOU_07420 [Cytophagales bacterium]
MNNLRNGIVCLVLLLGMEWATWACPVCERNQPKALKGIVHGAGPESNWDYVGVVITGIIACFTLFYSVKWLIKPGEKNQSHIKYSILN